MAIIANCTSGWRGVDVCCGGAVENNLDLQVSYRSGRASEARFYARGGKIAKIIALALTVLFTLLGVVLLLAGQSVGWLVLSLGVWIVVPVQLTIF